MFPCTAAAHLSSAAALRNPCQYNRGLWGKTTVGYNPSIYRWHYMQEQGLLFFDVSIVTLLLLCSQEAMVRGTRASGVCNKGCCDLL